MTFAEIFILSAVQTYLTIKYTATKTRAPNANMFARCATNLCQLEKPKLMVTPTHNSGRLCTHTHTRTHTYTEVIREVSTGAQFNELYLWLVKINRQQLRCQTATPTATATATARRCRVLAVFKMAKKRNVKCEMRIKGTSNISIIVARNEHAALHKARKEVVGEGEERAPQWESEARSKASPLTSATATAKAMGGCTVEAAMLENTLQC